jgi:hypothetical protein
MVAGNIRDWNKALAARCNWGWLRGCFGPTISPTDVDFIVERRGHFLVGEIKRPDQEVPQGQMILLEALSRLPQFTVFILVGDIEGHEIEPTKLLILGQEWQPASTETFRAFCTEWTARANGS